MPYFFLLLLIIIESFIIELDGLLFLVEGLLPFLQVFYSCYFDLPSCSQSDPKRVISENICSMLLVSGGVGWEGGLCCNLTLHLFVTLSAS